MVSISSSSPFHPFTCMVVYLGSPTCGHLRRPTSDGRGVSPLPSHTECTVRCAPPRTPSFRIVEAESDRHTTTSAGFVICVLVGCFYNAWIRRFIRCVPFRVLPNARRTWCFSSLVAPLPFRTALSKASWRRFLSLCSAWRRSPPVLPSLSGRRLRSSSARGTRRWIPPRARRLPRSSSSHPRILSHDTSTTWIDVGSHRSSTTTSVVARCSISRIDGSTVAWSLPSLRSCVLLLLSLSHDVPPCARLASTQRRAAARGDAHATWFTHVRRIHEPPHPKPIPGPQPIVQTDTKNGEIRTRRRTDIGVGPTDERENQREREHERRAHVWACQGVAFAREEERR